MATLAVALSAGMIGVVAPAAHAAPVAGGAWSTSFEVAGSSDGLQPIASTSYKPPVNVTGGQSNPGSLMPLGVTATASADNGSSEDASKAADGSASTKWLFSGAVGWLNYEFPSPVVAKAYNLVTANDAAGRNPKDWKVQGSNDNSTWNTLNTQTGQLPTTTPFFSLRNYTMPGNTTAYKYYRLDITANNGQPLTQLAEFELLDGSNNVAPATPMLVAPGNGPISARAAKTNRGWTGMKALQYVGSHQADGATATSTNLIYDNLNIPIGDASELSYKIFPVLDPTDLTWPATYAAVDLVLSDGTTTTLASQSNLRDSYGFDFNARSYGTSKALYGSQWNYVGVDLSSLSGKTIKKILLTYDNPNGSAATKFSGWLDDIVVKDATPIDGSSLTNYVDTRRGTNSTGSFSRGNNAPATAVPNGFNFLVPMTNATSRSWMYEYQSGNDTNNQTVLQGLGISHIPSPWMGDRAQFSVMPDVSGPQPSGNPATRGKTFSHDNEIAQPDFYSVKLDNGQTAEMTATMHGGVFRFTENTAGATSMRILVDKVAGDGELNLTGENLAGWVEGGSGLSVGNSRMFVAGTFSKTPTASGVASSRSGSAYGSFPISAADKTVELRFATSFISQAQAQLNLDREVIGKSFGDVRNAAKAQWNDRLGVIDLSDSSATPSQLLTTYSSLYRLNLYPNVQHEDVSPLGSATPDWKYASPVSAKTGTVSTTVTNAQIKPGKMYVNNGFWDTYRTVWPIYAFLYPDLAQELVDGFIQQYRDGGWVARWSSPGYADLMTGTSSDASFAEAYTAGAISTSLAVEAYDAALKNATALPASNRKDASYSANQVGRKALDKSIFLGYTPSSLGQSVSWGLEGLINDYAIGKMAEKLAVDPNISTADQARYTEEAAYFHNRAIEYVNLFDPAVGFFQARNEDGTWDKTPATYDPADWGNHAYTETNGWNFAWHTPYDADGLAALYGGKQGLMDKLEEFYTTPETATTSGIHEAFEQRDVRMGMFGMSNQIAHHIPYISASAGDPSTTQEVVGEVLQRLFVGSEIGQGYSGDEDNGEQSSWFIFSALGFYPLALGSGEYTIGSPLFDKVVVRRGANHGGNLTITAANQARDNVYISSANLDGTPLTSTKLNQAALRSAHALNFSMASTPQSWGERNLTASIPTPLSDATGSDVAVVTTSEGTSAAALVDNNSTTAVTFTTDKPSITIRATGIRPTVSTYTITNAVSGATPKSWTLFGSNNGDQWTEIDSRSAEVFPWKTQTRPFQLASPSTFEYFKLAITDTDTGAAPRIAEIELLAGPAAADELTVFASNANAKVGESFSGVLATVAGGATSDPADYTATVDFGTGPQPATVSGSSLGLQVKLPHTFATAGTHVVQISVSDGTDTATGTAAITATRSNTLGSQFNNACLSIQNVGANCDSLGYAYDKAQLALASNGELVQGVEKTVPGTALKFVLPTTANGAPDNILGEGQTFRLNPGTGATKISFIGMGNEGDQTGTGVLTYSDGSTENVPVEFGDWVGKAGAPAFGNIVVGKIQTRLAGTGFEGSNKTTAIFATAPHTLQAGKTPMWFTLPNKSGGLGSGKIHLFAVASDGNLSSVPPALTVTESTTAIPAAGPGTPITVDFGTVSGGDPGMGGIVTNIYWGDGTAAGPGLMTGNGVSGTHTYAASGRYTVTLVIDDGVESKVVKREIRVTGGTAATVALQASLTAPTTTQALTLKATVTTGATGSVEFRDGTSVIGTAAIVGSVATLELAPQTAGAHTYTATYLGDSTYRSGDVGTKVLTVTKAVPEVALTSNVSEVVTGGTVVLTVTLPTDASGDISLEDNGSVVGTGTLANGEVQISVTAGSAGSHNYVAKYSGDAKYASANSAATSVPVTLAEGEITLSAANTTITVSESTEVVATLKSDATGTVEFFNGTQSLGSKPVNSAGKATITISGLALGSHSITGKYSGDQRYGEKTSSPLVITALRSSVQISAPVFTKSSQIYGSKSVAKVSVTVKGATSGKVTFTSGKVALGSAPIVKSGSSYKATLTLNKNLKVGTYRGTSAFLPVAATTAAATSPAAKTFTVKKATTKSVKVSGSKYRRGTTAKVTVKVAKLSNGAYGSGKVTVYVGKKAVKTVKLKASKRGKVTVKIASKYTKRASIKVKAKFVPSSKSTVSAKTSKTVKIKAR